MRDLVVIAGWFAGLSALYWIAVLAVCGRPGFPLDDSFIHLQFARNLYHDGQMAFNHGVPSAGSTAPLYPVLIAAFYHVLGNWHLASFALGAVCGLGVALAVYGIIRAWTGSVALARWAGVLTALASPTVVQSYSGMEASAYSLLFLLGLWLYGSPPRRLIGSTLLACGVWLRPEFAVFLPLILLERAVFSYRGGGRRFVRWLSESWPHGLIWVPMACLYVVYHHEQSGHLLPATFAAKVLVPIDANPAWLQNLPAAVRNGDWGAAALALLVWPLLVLTVVGVGLGTVCAPVAFGLREAIIALWRNRGRAAAGWRLAIIALVGYPLARGMVDSLGVFWFQQHRYYAHLTPLVILVVLGALPATGAVVKRPWWNWTGLGEAVQRRRTFGWALVYSVALGAFSVIAVSNITSMQVELGEWLRNNTAEDQLIATNDIGAIGFISGRPILDTVGLVEPALVDHYLAGGDLLGYLKRRNPARVVIFPNWYRDLSARQDMLEPVHAIELDLNVICVAGTGWSSIVHCGTGRGRTDRASVCRFERCGRGRGIAGTLRHPAEVPMQQCGPDSAAQLDFLTCERRKLVPDATPSG